MVTMMFKHLKFRQIVERCRCVFFFPFPFICNIYLHHILPFFSTWAENCVCCQCLICKNSYSITPTLDWHLSISALQHLNWNNPSIQSSPTVCETNIFLHHFAAKAVECVKQGSCDFVLVLSLFICFFTQTFPRYLIPFLWLYIMCNSTLTVISTTTHTKMALNIF